MTYCIYLTSPNITLDQQQRVYIENLNATLKDEVNICFPLSSIFRECIKWKLDEEEYTLDKFFTLTYNVTPIFQYKLGNYYLRRDGSAFVCVPDEQRPMFYFLDYLYFVLCIVSTISLVIAIIIELIQPIKNQDYKPLVCHMVCLLVFYVTRSLLYAIKNPERNFCYVLSYLTRYSIRAAFTWITVINFGLWQRVRPSNILKGKNSDSKYKFFWESVFAWILAAFIMICTYFLQYVREIPDREEQCSTPLSRNKVQNYFFYGSTAFLLLVNIVLFLLTIFYLCQFSSGVSLANDKINKQLFHFYFKLMIVSGLYWILEMPVWFTAHGTNHLYSLIVDIVTFSQGFFLFLLVYVCRKSMFSQMKKQIQKQIQKQNTKLSSLQKRFKKSITSSTVTE